MMISESFDKACRENRVNRSIQKIDTLMDRLEMTVNDISRNHLYSKKDKRKIIEHIEKRINKFNP